MHTNRTATAIRQINSSSDTAAVTPINIISGIIIKDVLSVGTICDAEDDGSGEKLLIRIG